MGTTYINLQIGTKQIEHPFIIVRGMSRNFIIGRDFLNKHKVRLYFDSQSMKLDQEYIPLQGDMNIASILRLLSKTTLPPNSINFVPVKLKHNPYFKPGDTIEVTEMSDSSIMNEPLLNIPDGISTVGQRSYLSVIMLNSAAKTVNVHCGLIVGKVRHTTGKRRSADS